MKTILEWLKKEFRKRKAQNEVDYLKQLQTDIIHDPRRLSHLRGRTLTEEQKKQIDDFFIENYGQRIDYTCHLTYTAFSGKFDVRYVPETIYIPEIDHYLNMFVDYNTVLQDKNITPYISNAVNIKTPRVLFKSVMGMIMDAKGDIVDKKEISESLQKRKAPVFVKPTIDSGGGNGCFLIDFPNGETDSASGKSIDDVLNEMGANFVIQEKLHCHESISQIYPNSVNTFRVMTYRWRNSIKVAPTVMRIGIGGMYVDNASAGGVFVALDDRGNIISNALTEFGEEYGTHPDTGVKFKGYTIPLFPKVLEAALRLHKAIPQIGLANWDFTIDEDGDVVLIEANLNYGGVWLFQMVHGCGAFGEDTGAILQWVRKIKRMPIDERKRHAFGY